MKKFGVFAACEMPGGAWSVHERRNVGVVEGLEPVFQFHSGEAELRVRFDVVFESVHRVLVEHVAVRVFEPAFFEPAAPVVGKVKPVQVLDDFYLVH